MSILNQLDDFDRLSDDEIKNLRITYSEQIVEKLLHLVEYGFITQEHLRKALELLEFEPINEEMKSDRQFIYTESEVLSQLTFNQLKDYLFDTIEVNKDLSLSVLKVMELLKMLSKLSSIETQIIIIYLDQLFERGEIAQSAYRNFYQQLPQINEI